MPPGLPPIVGVGLGCETEGEVKERRYDRESLREWADEHGHTDDYARCNGCGNARQDCTCGGDDEDEPYRESEASRRGRVLRAGLWGGR